MTPDEALKVLTDAGALDAETAWSVERAAGGLNTLVLRIHAADDPTGYIARFRETGSFAHEVEALADVADCPGVPAVIFASERTLVHRYLDGSPRPLDEVSAADLDHLARVLTCLHGHTYPDYTPWPVPERVTGSRADLFSFRVQTLKSYDAFPRAAAGAVDSRLPELLEWLGSAELVEDESWEAAEFSRLHGDLSYGNILWSDVGVALIDWEFSRVGDPAEEVGYLLTEQGASGELAGKVREAYARAGGSRQVWSRVPAYALYTAVDSVLWWADYATTHDIDPGEEISRRIETALRWTAVLPRG